MQWFEKDPATNRIRGWLRGGKALPADRPDAAFVECTDADIGLYSQLQAQAEQESREPDIRHEGGTLALPPDTRPRFSMTTDKTLVRADGLDQIVLTVTARRADGGVRAAFNQQVVYELGERLIALDFVNGVATRTLKMPKSGRVRLGSNRNVKIDTPADLTVVE